MNVVFDDSYYESVIQGHGYRRLDFREIDFSLGALPATALRQMWLCHHDGETFVSSDASPTKSIVTTGIGLSGPPHLGTVSQIVRAIALQRAGVNVQFVLGDLDSFNARNQSREKLADLVPRYRTFISRLGFDTTRGTLRTQEERIDILLTAYRLGNCLRDVDFDGVTEDLSELYRQRGIYPGMEFPVKLSILLMIGDFLDLHLSEQFDRVMITLGLEEHLYVLLAKEVARRNGLKVQIGAMYSRIIRGLNGFPKMSKSIPGSGITADMDAEEIRRLVLTQHDRPKDPWDCAVFQMIAGASRYTPAEMEDVRSDYLAGEESWERRKAEYAEQLVEICEAWPR